MNFSQVEMTIFSTRSWIFIIYARAIKNVEEFTFVSFHDKGLRNLGKKTLEEKLNLQHDEFYMNESLFLYERDFGMIDSGNVCEGHK